MSLSTDFSLLSFDDHEEDFETDLETIAKKGVFPDPITLERTSDIENDIEGFITNENGDLIKNYFSYNKLGNFLVDIFDDWLDKRLKIQLETVRVNFNDGSQIYFTDPHFTKPTMNEKMSSNESYTMLPQTARSMHLTYAIDVYARPIFKDSNGYIYNLKESPVHIGKIPVMLGSKYCHLRGLDDSQLRRVGEDPSSCCGFFIVEGFEYVIIIREKMRTNKVMIFKYKDEIVCRLTLMNPAGGSIVNLSLIDDVINFYLPSLITIENETDKYSKKLKREQKMLNVFHLFKIAPILYPDLIEAETFESYRTILDNYILPFVLPERRSRVITELSKTIDLMTTKEINTDSYALFESLLIGNSNLKPGRELIISRIRKYIEKDFFPNLGNMNIEYKFLNLGSMIAKMGEYMAGFRTLDDKDSWVNKKLDTAAIMMEQLFKIKWDQLINFQLTKQKDKTRRSKKDENVSKYLEGFVTFEMAQRYLNEINMNEVTICFQNAFSKKWGVQNKFTRDNVVQRLKRDNLTSALSHVLRIDIESSHRETSQSIRAIQPTQFGYICPVHSPEGEPCGLVKNMAITCSITLNSDETEWFLIERFTNIRWSKEDLFYYKDDSAPTKVFFSPQDDYKNSFSINGKVYGFCQGTRIYDKIYEYKINGRIDRKTTVVIDKNQNVNIYTDGSRLVRPLLVVEGRNLRMDNLNLRGSRFSELIKQGAVVYVDPEEQDNNIKVASNVQDIQVYYDERKDIEEKYLEAKELYEQSFSNPSIPREKVDLIESGMKEIESIRARILKKKPYTHCQLHPEALLSISASLIPFIHHNQSARAAFQSSMSNQALSIYHPNHANRFDGKAKSLAFPSRPIAYSNMEEVFGLDKSPQGSNVIILFFPYKGMNAEDAMVMSKRSIDLGKFATMKYMSVSYTVRTDEPKFYEKLEKPNNLDHRESEYEWIGENGLPFLNAEIKPNQVVISVVQYNKENPNERPHRTGIKLAKYESGTVDKIHISQKNGKDLLVNVKLRTFHIPKQGDKFAARNAQKATLSLIAPVEDLPYTSQGITPDVIINPHCIPGRMTMSYLIEVLTGKSAALTGQRVSASPYEKIDLDKFFEILDGFGFRRDGKEVMYSGLTGKPIKRPMFIGPVYFQALRHQVSDKNQARASTGNVNAKTRQPTRGRSKDGGLRFGEMERDVLIAHGAAAFLKDRLCDASDAYQVAFCKQCGTIAVTDIIAGKNKCETCDPLGNKGKEGYFRQTIPFAFKNYMNLLTPLGIKLTFVTKYNLHLQKNIQRPQPTKQIPQTEVADEEPEEYIEEENIEAEAYGKEFYGDEENEEDEDEENEDEIIEEEQEELDEEEEEEFDEDAEDFEDLYLDMPTEDD